MGGRGRGGWRGSGASDPTPRSHAHDPTTDEAVLVAGFGGRGPAGARRSARRPKTARPGLPRRASRPSARPPAPGPWRGDAPSSPRPSRPLQAPSAASATSERDDDRRSRGAKRINTPPSLSASRSAAWRCSSWSTPSTSTPSSSSRGTTGRSWCAAPRRGSSSTRPNVGGEADAGPGAGAEAGGHLVSANNKATMHHAERQTGDSSERHSPCRRAGSVTD